MTAIYSNKTYPYYLDGSLPDGEITTKTQLSKSFTRLQLPVSQPAPPSTQGQFDAHDSLDDGLPPVKGTETHDLAEFLRTSRPEDYRKFLKSSASDEQLSVNSQKKGLRFLPSKWKDTRQKTLRTSSSSTLPTNVLPRITSRGMPYLQIHVDYAKPGSQYTKSTMSDRRTSHTRRTSEDSDFTYRHLQESIIGGDGDSPVTSPRPSSVGDRPSLKPAPWNAADNKVLDADTLETYHRFLNCEREESLNVAVETKPRSLSIEAVGGEGVRLSEYQRIRDRALLRTPPCSPLAKSSPSTPSADSIDSRSSTRNSALVKVQSRSSSLKRARKQSREASLRQSAVYDDNTDTEREGTAGPHSGQRRQNKKAPPRPGPPPTRSLPSLPEGHDSASRRSNRTSTIGTRNSFVSATDSFVSASTRSGSSCTSPSIENEAISVERKSREQRVKARKARDIQQNRLRREQGTETQLRLIDIGDAAIEQAKRGNCTPRASEIKSTTASQIKVILNEQPVNPSTATFLRSAVPHGSPTPPHSPGLADGIKTANNHPSAPSPEHNSSRSYVSERELELERRVAAVERKNRSLEQALIALIRGVMGQDERHAGLHRATGVDDLLKELKMVESSPSTSSSEQAAGD